MALLCTQHTHANPHTHTHIYICRLTHARYGYVQSLERWWLRRRLLLLLLCVCVLYVYLIDIYILYILSYWFKLFQRANTAFFFHAIFLISILLLFLCPATSPACVPPNESLNWNWNWATQEQHEARIRIYFCWMSGWMKRRANVLVSVCLCVCVPTRLF